MGQASLQIVVSLYLEVHDSWVVRSRVISPLIWDITIVTLIITPLLPTYEPTSTLNPKP